MLELSRGYREARKFAIFFGFLSLGWAAALFEFENFNLEILGASIAARSISTILGIALTYFFFRSLQEYVMQTERVRQWKSARFDFKISFHLFRMSALALSATTFYRSVESVLYVIAAVFALYSLYLIMTVLGMLCLTPLIMRIRKHTHGYSPVPMIKEAEGWAHYLSIGFGVGALILASLLLSCYWTTHGLWVPPASAWEIFAFIGALSLVFISYTYNDQIYLKIFLWPYKVNKNKDGSETIFYSDGSSLSYRRIKK